MGDNSHSVVHAVHCVVIRYCVKASAHPLAPSRKFHPATGSLNSLSDVPSVLLMSAQGMLVGTAPHRPGEPYAVKQPNWLPWRDIQPLSKEPLMPAPAIWSSTTLWGILMLCTLPVKLLLLAISLRSTEGAAVSVAAQHKGGSRGLYQGPAPVDSAYTVTGYRCQNPMTPQNT